MLWADGTLTAFPLNARRSREVAAPDGSPSPRADGGISSRRCTVVVNGVQYLNAEVKRRIDEAYYAHWVKQRQERAEDMNSSLPEC